MGKFKECPHSQFMGYHRYEKVEGGDTDKCLWCGDERPTLHREDELQQQSNGGKHE